MCIGKPWGAGYDGQVPTKLMGRRGKYGGKKASANES
ncbi:hypothetical protein PAECIP111891_05576 [Paenibacillus allorhizoplanae]|uniref:Uncharacterized protein n=1 Tax=Paenibacillus allorhizoplanae TaxID=2905648 RepID=A0ABM9CVG1_9BACL|nr:hypothetical protein PAECIP111891_05576 [Paenibacillus allorhizoplanae]